MVFAAMLLAASMRPPGLPARPPDGTYEYRVTVAGAVIEDSTVSISSRAREILVRDSTRIPTQDVSALDTGTFDTQTLLPTDFRADVHLQVGDRRLTSTFAPGQITFVVGSQRTVVQAQAGAPLEIASDNFVGTMVMIPAVLHATKAKALTLALTEGALSIFARIIRTPPDGRPTDVASSDRSVALNFAHLREVFWYDPKSFVVDDVEIPAQSARIQLRATSSQPATLLSPAPIVTPVPTPLPHFTSANVRFTSADGTRIAGTLTYPRIGLLPLPAVVLVAGTGPLNRDEQIGPNAIFLQLSNALSNAGYVVLRYDKRGVGDSGGSAASETRDDLVADAHAGFKYLARRSDVDPKHIYMLGHSEGGELVPSVAAEDPRVAGLILLAPPALPLWKVSLEQVLELAPPAKRALARHSELAALQAIRDGTRRGPGVAWMRSSMDVDPAKILKRVRAPVLILQGGADTQVLAKDLPRLVKAARDHNRDVTTRVFPGDTHLFMKLRAGEPATLSAETHGYMTAAGRVDPRVIQTILTWLRAHTPQSDRLTLRSP